MFTQSCSFLQNNKQTPLHHNLGPVHHNFGLLTTRNYSNLTKTFVDIKSNSTAHAKHVSFSTKTNLNALDIFPYSNRFTSRSNLSTEKKNLKQRNNCKEVLEISSVPFTSSYIIGGFVGSKSQLGRHLTQGVSLKMWDIISGLGIVDLISNNSRPIDNVKNSFGRQHSTIESELHCLKNNCKVPNVKPNYCTSDRNIQPLAENKEKQCSVYKKQSYADVTKINLPMVCGESSQINLLHQPNCVVSCNENKQISNTRLNLSSKFGPNLAIEQNNNILLSSSEDSKHLSMNSFSPIQNRSNEKNLINNNEKDLAMNCESLSRALPKSILKKTPTKVEQLDKTSKVESRSAVDMANVSFLQNRDRIVSQCSDDSEGSFIVFEHSEDDSSSVNVDGDEDSDNEDTDETSSCESDTDSTSNFEDLSSEMSSKGQSQLNCQSDPPQTKSQCSFQPERKRVRFAEGADLVTVLEMNSEDTNGRSEWDFHALDCWRFRQRIRQVETNLQCVLEPAHRQRIYLQRFAD